MPADASVLPQQPRCGEAAVKLLNCFAAKELDSCSTELAAFRACASKSKLKEFMLLEECPAPPAAAKSLAAKSKVASAPPAPSASPSPQ
mmetsp:Transcript_24112/g.38839  ORF Transcript_24112/g.38839 Transcript_24112/m.38839 type:complete len:89 (+) Transcript_24112:19-285(+)